MSEANPTTIEPFDPLLTELIEAFGDLFAAMGVTSPDAKDAIIRDYFSSEAVQQEISALAAQRLNETDPDMPRQEL